MFHRQGRLRKTARSRINNRLRDPKLDGIRHFLSSVISVWKLIVFLVVIGIMTAMFEGGSLGLLAGAVSVLTSDDPVVMFGQLGSLGATLSEQTRDLDRNQIFILLVLIAICFQLFKSVLAYTGMRVALRLTNRIRIQLAEVATRHVMRFDYSEISRHRAGELAAKVATSGELAQILYLIHVALVASLLLVVYFVLMLIISIPLSLIVFIAGALIMWGMGFIIKRLKALSALGMEKTLLMSRYTVEFFNSARLIRIFSATRHAERLINHNRLEAIKAQERQQAIKGVISPFMEVVTIVGASIFLISGLYVFEGSIESKIPALFLFLLAMYRALPQLQTIASVRSSIATSVAGFSVLNDLLKSEGKTFTRLSGLRVPKLANGVSFERVSFSYDTSGGLVLKDINLEIPHRSTVALVGESGAGKSTLADLALGLIHPTSGKVSVDGVDLAHSNQETWLNQIGAVEQDVFLLNDSIGKNISFGSDQISASEIKEAAKLAVADEFIEALPDGYDTIIGDRGLRLSGGQRQRIALARAFVRGPRFLVLDEATSALDSRSERAIQQALENIRHQFTVFVIAHRLSTIAASDHICVLDRGELTEQGSFADLLSKRGRFWELWEMQTTSEGESLSGPGEVED